MEHIFRIHILDLQRALLKKGGPSITEWLEDGGPKDACMGIFKTKERPWPLPPASPSLVLPLDLYHILICCNVYCRAMFSYEQQYMQSSSMGPLGSPLISAGPFSLSSPYDLV
eukprot:TRINITY_DN13112_c0_g1_i1.p1 TRINITY_DN13112_c0_g1~~TRINITY_DN13112_c0_g1_i1.p1  ORF type:complete len:113 (+),score=6.50 TRINITY_DN13112_c0_g1_i1:301-639(+)